MARLKLCFENSEVSTLHGCVVRPLQSEKTLLSLRECYMVAVILLLLPSLPRHLFLLLAASTLPNPGIDFFFLWYGRSRSKARSLHEKKL